MVAGMRRLQDLRGVVAVLLALGAIAGALVLTGCGSSLKQAEDEEASADVDAAAAGSCGQTALEALGHLAGRVYREGVQSERVDSARRMIEGSPALREAVEAGDARAARAAGRALIATGHL